MADQERAPQKPQPPSSTGEDRRARLGAALRANLRRRKEQERAKAREASGEAEKGDE